MTAAGEKTAKVVRATQLLRQTLRSVRRISSQRRPARARKQECKRTLSQQQSAKVAHTSADPIFATRADPFRAASFQQAAALLYAIARSPTGAKCLPGAPPCCTTLQPAAHWPSAQPAALQRSLVLRLSQTARSAANLACTSSNTELHYSQPAARQQKRRQVSANASLAAQL